MKAITPLVVLVMLMTTQCTQDPTKQTESLLRHFISEHEAKLQRLQKDFLWTYWQTATAGNDSSYQDLVEQHLEYAKGMREPGTEQNSDFLRFQINNLYANPDDYEYLCRIRDSGAIQDTLLMQQLRCLIGRFRCARKRLEAVGGNAAAQANIGRVFKSAKYNINGDSLSVRQMLDMMDHCNDASALKAAWGGLCQVYPTLKKDIHDITRYKNDIAHDLGFANGFELHMHTVAMETDELMDIIKAVDAATRDTYRHRKQSLDAQLARQFNISQDQLEPYHYGRLCISGWPSRYACDCNDMVAGRDVVGVVSDYFKSVGLSADGILEKSDLHSHAHKDPRSFMIELDEDDVRVSTHLDCGHYSLRALMHVLAHAEYELHISKNLPYLLRDPYMVMTEGVAYLFTHMTIDPEWLQAVGFQMDETSQAEMAQFNQDYRLYFLRLCMANIMFAKQAFENPDIDLATTWWEQISTYLEIPMPANPHANWPVNMNVALMNYAYQGWFVALLVESQLKHTLQETLPGPHYALSPQMGKFLKSRIFNAGASMHWERLLYKATGDSLDASFFINEFVQDPV